MSLIRLRPQVASRRGPTTFMFALPSIPALVYGTSGVLLIMAGYSFIFRARGLWNWWFGIEQAWRQRRFEGGWSPLERSLGRRTYFWIPEDVELRTPDDVYVYALSDRFWRSRYAWAVRALCWYAGGLFLFFAFGILGFVLPQLP